MVIVVDSISFKLPINQLPISGHTLTATCGQARALRGRCRRGALFRERLHFAGGREHAVQGLTREVALAAHAAVVLAHPLRQLDARPLALGELRLADEAQSADL